MKTFKNYTEGKGGFVQLNKDLRTPGFLPPGQKKPKLTLRQRSSPAILGALKKRGGAERYDKYDKGNAKKKKEILQNELGYYLANRYEKPYNKLSKQEKWEVLDDIDDKFAHSSTYKSGSIWKYKISSSGKIT
jgi:hypothetical protein